jgi:hypothetical protein
MLLDIHIANYVVSIEINSNVSGFGGLVVSMLASLRASRL